MSLVFNMVGGGSGGGSGPSSSDAILTVTVPTGSTVTATKGGVTLTPTMWVQAADPTLDCALFVIAPSLFDAQNPWTVTATLGTDSASDSVTISANKQYDIVLSYRVPADYQEVEYLESAGHQSIDSGLDLTTTSYFNLEAAFTRSDNNNNVYGLGYSGLESNVLVAGNTIYNQIGGVNVSIPYDTNKHVYAWKNTTISIDAITGNAGSNLPTGNRLRLFATAYGGSFSSDRISYARIYSCKMYSGANIIRDFVPCYRKSDSVAGMYDIVNDVFYTNSGTGTFVVGPDV